MAADWEAQAGTDQPLHTLRTQSQGCAVGGCFRICLYGPFLPEEPPKWTWPTGLRSSWPGQVLQLTHHSAGPWVPRHLLLRVPLTTICLGCHGLPHAQEQGPGSPEADSPTGRNRKTHHCLLHDNCSCPHPPPLGSPSKGPLFPGPLRVEGWPVRLKQKSLGPFTVLLTIIFLPAWSVTRFLELWQPSQATRLRTDITSPEVGV